MTTSTQMSMPYSVSPAQKKAVLTSTARGNARQAIGTISPGCRVIGLTKGQFSLLDVIASVLAQVGPANLTVSTWTPGKAEIDSVLAMLHANRITGFRLLVDRSFITRHPEYMERFRALGEDTIRQTRTHAKFALIAAGDYRITIRTSMNFNSNPRLEQFDLDDDPAIYDFFNEAIDHLFTIVPPGTHASKKAIEDGFRDALPEELTEGESIADEWGDAEWSDFSWDPEF